MCGACGILGGGPEWLDRVENPEGVPHRVGLTAVAERQRRIALVNLLLASRSLRLWDFGRRLIIAAPTGRTEIVDDLRHAWLHADRLSNGRIDPLDPDVLELLESAAEL